MRWLRPVVLSVAIHGLLLGLLALAPLQEPERGHVSTAPDHALVIGWSPESPRRKTPPREPDGWVDLAPTLVVPSGLPVPVIGTGSPHKGGSGEVRNEGGSPSRTRARPDLLQVPGTARSVVFVVDRSMSMGPSGALEIAKREVAACLRRLSPDVSFQVVPYNKMAEPLRFHGRGELTNADPELVEEAIRQLERLPASGSTDHLRALRRALLLRPEVLYLLTDADDLDVAGVRVLTGLNAGRTAIHVVELNAGRAEGTLLQRLAASNRGTYRRVALAR